MSEDKLQMLERSTAVIAFGHVLLAMLIVADRAGYSGRNEGMLGRSAEHPMWVVAHFGCAIALALGLATKQYRMAIQSVTAGCLIGWSILMWAWAIQLNPDATWAVGILGTILGIASYICRGLWADQEA